MGRGRILQGIKVTKIKEVINMDEWTKRRLRRNGYSEIAIREIDVHQSQDFLMRKWHDKHN